MRVYILMILVLGTSWAVLGQAKQWRTQGPCDNAFTVSVPTPLYKVAFFEGAHGASLDADVGFDSPFASYVSLQAEPIERQYGIVVFDVAQKDLMEFKRGNLGGFKFIIGGDDAEPTSEKVVHSNGLAGKEYVYAKAIGPDRYTRGRAFYFNKRMYFLIVISRSVDDLTSSDADRFLDSFSIRKKKR